MEQAESTNDVATLKEETSMDDGTCWNCGEDQIYCRCNWGDQ